MGSTLCLLSCALAIGQVSDWPLQPQLTRGQELVYSGSFTEESLSPGVHFQRGFRVDTTALVLDATAQKFDLAVFTVLTSRAKPGGGEPVKTAPLPSSVRLELASLDRQGKLHGAVAGQLAAPLDGPPTIECGAFVEVPKGRVGINHWWEVNEDGRPPRTWRVDGTEMVNNVLCVRVIGTQQSEDWDAPRADRTAWQRRDTVWMSPQLGIACRFQRVIERRDAARKDPTHRSVLDCRLDTGLTYPGKLLDDRVNEIKQARRFYEESDALIGEPEQNKARLEAILKKIKQYSDSEPPTPYRKAVLQVQKRVEAALRGETVPGPQPDAIESPKQGVAVGQRVPDFVCTDLLTRQTQRLQRLLGQPVLVAFYNPATENGQRALRLGQTLVERYPQGVTILAMAVTDDPELAQKQHKEMKLPFSIHDGNGMLHLFGVEALPRLVVLDAKGLVRGSWTGWGTHTTAEVNEQLRKAMTK
jgi:hypothetical protein